MVDYGDFVKGRRVITQAELEELLGRPATAEDKAAVIAAIAKEYPQAGIVPTTKANGKWEIVWGLPGDSR
jgi:hypothetical protein